MKKNLIIATLAGLVFASCANDDFIGSASKTEGQTSSEFISFGGQSNKLTRAALTGPEAAEKLNNQFRVLGTITKTGTTSNVFDNYYVNYVGTPGSDDSNSYGWSYLAGPNTGTQELKYWDLQASKYEFIAFAGLDDAKRIASTEANRFPVDESSIQGLYISNKVTATYSGADGVQYGNKVNFTFNRMSARMRVGIYETVPGYAVANVRFYYGDDLLTTDIRKAQPTAGIQANFPTDGEYTVTYDGNGVAMANFQEGGTKDPFKNFGTLAYTKASNASLEVSADGKLGVIGAGQDKFLSTSSAQPTWAKAAATLDGGAVASSDWQTILPYPAYNAQDANDDYINRRMTIRVDYDLVPLDGGPVINVYGATAAVPYEWTMWKPNYAYTYIFKISDATSGSTIPPYINTEDPSAPDPGKDTDGDGIPDTEDDDIDGDGIPNDQDPDIDGDGIPNEEDPFPYNPATPDNPDTPVIPIDPNTENPNPHKPAVSPIVFDAEVSAIEDFNNETITGLTELGGNAITTYSETSKVTDAAEYKVGETIVVSSPSHGRWGVAFSTTETTEKTVADNNTFDYTWIAGNPTGAETINEVSEYSGKFTVTQAGYYVIWLRYLPTGMADVDGNYVDIFKIVKTHE